MHFYSKAIKILTCSLLTIIICVYLYEHKNIILYQKYYKGYFNRLVIVLVLYNAGPLDVSWAVNSDKVGAILEGYLPAQVNFHLDYNLFMLPLHSDWWKCPVGCVNWCGQSSW